MIQSWQTWAVLSAVFAALTAIFAKVGVDNVYSEFATFIRTIVILDAAGVLVTVTGQWQRPPVSRLAAGHSSFCRVLPRVRHGSAISAR